MIELLIVAVILGLMATAVVIGARQFMEGSKNRRAQTDVIAIKNAIFGFYTDGSEYPNRKNKMQSINDWDNRYKLLYSAPEGADSSNPTVFYPKLSKDAGKSFRVGLQDMDDLSNHLVKATGRGYLPKKFNWPYVQKLDLDPWGRAYVINIYNLNDALDDKPPEADQPYVLHHTWVLSSGKNGIIETADTSKSNENPPALGGDDVGELLE